MKRLLFSLGSLLGLVALVVLALAIVFSLQAIPGNTEPSSHVFQSPIETPSTVLPTRLPTTPLPTQVISASPYPTTGTPTPVMTPSVEPTVLATMTPIPASVPTSLAALPPGPKIVYKQYDNGAVSVWAVSGGHPEFRQLLVTIPDPQRFGVRVGISHDETRIAYTVFSPNQDFNSFAAELQVADLDGSQPRTLATQVDIGRFVNYPLWSLDDQLITFSRQTATEPPFIQTINAISLTTGQVSTLASADESTWLWPLDWSPDGRYFYYMRGTTHAELWRADVEQGGNEYLRLVWEGAAPRCYFLSHDGQWLLCTVLESRSPVRYAIIIVPTGQGEVETLISGATDDLYNPIWYPNGQEVTFNLPPHDSEQTKLQSLNLQTWSIRTITVAEGINFVPKSWSPDGQWLAVQQFPETDHDVLLINYDGTQINRVSQSEGTEIVSWITRDLPGRNHMAPTQPVSLLTT